MYIYMSSTVASDMNTLVTVSKDNCNVILNVTKAFSRDVMSCHCSCRLFSFIELYCHEGNSHFSSIIAGYMDSRCLSVAAFVKKIDSLFYIVVIL